MIVTLFRLFVLVSTFSAIWLVFVGGIMTTVVGTGLIDRSLIFKRGEKFGDFSIKSAPEAEPTTEANVLGTEIHDGK